MLQITIKSLILVSSKGKLYTRLWMMIRALVIKIKLFSMGLKVVFDLLSLLSFLLYLLSFHNIHLQNTLRFLEVQHQLNMAEKELEKKFSQTGAYKNLKKMLASKNDTIKEMRKKLNAYEPDTNCDEEREED